MPSNADVTSNTLLQPDDPAPVELINAQSTARTVLVCEHAGNIVPAKLNGMGIGADQLNDHIGWDIGAAAVTRQLAARLGFRAMLQRYSRLVIDCNRPPTGIDSIPVSSHGVPIPANKQLKTHERQQRIDEIFMPFDTMLETQLSSRRCTLALSIHSFTPVLNNISRPWDIGFLFRKDVATSSALAQLLQRAYPQLVIGMNEPYAIDDNEDWFVPRYGEKLGLKHSLIEIRNDHLRTEQGQQWWSQILATIITQFLEE